MTKRHDKRARRQRQAEVDPIEVHLDLDEMSEDEMSELARFAFRAARRVGVDSCAGISDDDIALALIEEPILLCAAKHLSDLYGRMIAREDLAGRIEASPRLQNVHSASQWARDQRLLAQCATSLSARVLSSAGNSGWRGNGLATNADGGARPERFCCGSVGADIAAAGVTSSAVRLSASVVPSAATS